MANKLDRLRELVASAGIDVNWRPNGTGTTALMDAANQGYVQAIDILIGAGADPSVEMWNGWTALAFWRSAYNDLEADPDRLLSVETMVCDDRFWAGLLAGTAVFMLFWFV